MYVFKLSSSQCTNIYLCHEEINLIFRSKISVIGSYSCLGFLIIIYIMIEWVLKLTLLQRIDICLCKEEVDLIFRFKISIVDFHSSDFLYYLHRDWTKLLLRNQ